MHIHRSRLLALLGMVAATTAAAEPNPFDKDGDLIADSVDKCPDAKEDYNGFKDDDGCPDQTIADLLKPGKPVPAPVAEPVPEPANVLPAPAPQPLLQAPAAADTFTCTAEVRSYDSILGAKIRCDGDPSSWWLSAGEEMVLPDAVRSGARGKFVLKRHSSDRMILVSFETADGRVHEPKKKSDCFLTTAAAHHRGLPDDCDALQTMRAFRDEVLGHEHPDVVRYYALAPRIVVAIEGRENAEQVWEVVFTDYLTPILALVRAGRNDEAHAAYRHLVEDLSTAVRS